MSWLLAHTRAGAVAMLLAVAMGCTLLSDRSVALCETAELIGKEFQSGTRTLSEVEAAVQACTDSIKQDVADGSFLASVLERLRELLQGYLDDLLGGFATKAQADADDRVVRLRALVDVVNAELAKLQ